MLPVCAVRAHCCIAGKALSLDEQTVQTVADCEQTVEQTVDCVARSAGKMARQLSVSEGTHTAGALVFAVS